MELPDVDTINPSSRSREEILPPPLPLPSAQESHHQEEIPLPLPPPPPPNAITIINTINTTSTTATTTTPTTQCPTRFGNFKKNEIFQQEKSRKRQLPGGSPITTLPTFVPMEVKKNEESFIVLNERLIPKETEFYMIVIIPTLARLDKQTNKPLDYLNQTISEYAKQMNDSSTAPLLEGKKILFLVQGFVNEKEHLLFHELSVEYRHVEEFVFFVPPFRFVDPYGDIPNVDYLNPSNVYPGKMARQQTCDIVFLTDFVLRNFKFKYMLYTEDDFVPCGGMLRNVFSALQDIEWYYSDENVDRPSFDKGMCSMRIATGLGGFILTPLSAELFVKFIKDNIQFEPIDILILYIMYNSQLPSTFDTCVTRGYTSFVYRKSQLKHIGGVSNWSERNNKKNFGDRIIGCSWSLENGFVWDLAQAHKFNPTHRKCPRGNQRVLPCV